MKTMLHILIAAFLALSPLPACAADLSTNLNPRFTGEFLGEAPPPSEPLSLWYRRPAAQWVEALAIGNGRLGAMVFGRVGQERLQLNEDTLWAGAPYTPDNPEALAAIPEVRKLLRSLEDAKENPGVLLYFAGQADGLWTEGYGQAARFRAERTRW